MRSMVIRSLLMVIAEDVTNTKVRAILDRAIKDLGDLPSKMPRVNKDWIKEFIRKHPTKKSTLHFYIDEAAKSYAKEHPGFSFKESRSFIDREYNRFFPKGSRRLMGAVIAE